MLAWFKYRLYGLENYVTKVVVYSYDGRNLNFVNMITYRDTGVLLCCDLGHYSDMYIASIIFQG